MAGDYYRVYCLLGTPPAVGNGGMTAGKDDDNREVEEDGPLAGWALTRKQKSFLQALLPDDVPEEPEATPPPDEP